MLQGWPRMASGTGTACPACLPAFFAQCCLCQPSLCLAPGDFPAARGVPIVVVPPVTPGVAAPVLGTS